MEDLLKHQKQQSHSSSEDEFEKEMEIEMENVMKAYEDKHGKFRERVFGFGFHLPGNSGCDAHGTHIFLHLETDIQNQTSEKFAKYTTIFLSFYIRFYDSFTVKLTKP